MKIKCPICGVGFESDDALVSELAEDIKKKLGLEYEKKLKAELAVRGQQSAEEENERQRKIKTQLEFLQKKAEADREINESLRKQVDELISQIKTLSKEKDTAKIDAQKDLDREAERIRKEEAQKAEERHRLEKKQLEEMLNQTRKSLDEAKARSEQGSGQQKGEALELDLENSLRGAYLADEISEIRKGVSGADISQRVKNSRLVDCGVILYECKNAKWKKAWIEKLKENVRAAGANIGVLVATDLPVEYGEIHQVEGHIWAVPPRLAVVFAAAMRHQLILMASAIENNKSKDKKLEYLYQFLVGPEFRARIEAVIGGYNKLQAELEKEKRAAKTRWSHQEKAIRMMIDSTFEMYGDFQGLLGGELAALPESLSGEEIQGVKELIVEDFLEMDVD